MIIFNSIFYSDDNEDEVSDMTEMRTPPPQPPTTLDLSAVANIVNDINSPLTPVEGKIIVQRVSLTLEANQS